MRALEELTATEDPAWPVLEPELRAGGITILPIEPAAGRESLYRLQVTTRSGLGALALHTGGLLVDGGWLRVLGGGGAAGLPALGEADDLPVSLLVGYDVLGGRFELNGAGAAALGRPGETGELCYFAPDTLEWEALEVGHSAWLSWLTDGGAGEFYRSMRWPGWQDEVGALPLTHGLSVFPFLWSREAQQDLAATFRGPAPMTELFAVQDEFAARFTGSNAPTSG